tara:strand:+ start:197 stop:541 length:345 start_codon:yes stop_codon:yes gene_type:complete
LTSRNILLIEDSNGHNQSCHKELEEEGFTISLKSSAEEALKIKNQSEIIILNLKLNNEANKNLLKKFKEQNTPVILCSEWGKDKMSFPLWASEVKIVKAGDQNDLKWTIKETLE